MTFNFLFFVPCFVHLSFLYVLYVLCCMVCLALKNASVAALLSEHFRSLFIQGRIALLQGVSGNNSASRP